MNDREVATVLHALRSLLDDEREANTCDHFEDVEPLSVDEIDSLYERINLAPAGPRKVTVWSLTSNLVDRDGWENIGNCRLHRSACGFCRLERSLLQDR